MRKLNLALILPALSLLAFVPMHAATPIINNGNTAPTITPPSVGAFFGYNGNDYDGGNGFTDGANPGQTFLTSGASASYTLDSITLQESGGSNFNPTTQTFILGIFSVSGNTLTSLGTEEYSFNGTAPGYGGYFTLDTSALGLTLAGNTEYAFGLTDGASPNYPNYLGLVSSPYGNTTTGQDSYSNGVAIRSATPLAAGQMEAINIPTANGADYDRAFSVQLTSVAVPEPSTWAMMVAGAMLVFGLVRTQRRTS